LRLAGDPPDAEHLERARAFILDAGGLERARVFTHVWFALFGLWSWDDVPALPPEVLFLPAWFPLNVYDFACWARQAGVALSLLGYPLDHPVMRAGLEGLDRFTIVEDPDGPDGVRRLEACQSPVWDTALAVIGLSDAGVAGEHPALVRAGEWLVGEQIRVPGDWAVRRPDLEP